MHRHSRRQLGRLLRYPTHAGMSQGRSKGGIDIPHCRIIKRQVLFGNCAVLIESLWMTNCMGSFHSAWYPCRFRPSGFRPRFVLRSRRTSAVDADQNGFPIDTVGIGERQPGPAGAWLLPARSMAIRRMVLTFRSIAWDLRVLRAVSKEGQSSARLDHHRTQQCGASADKTEVIEPEMSPGPVFFAFWICAPVGAWTWLLQNKGIEA